MSSAISTSSPDETSRSGLSLFHVYALLGMMAAAAAVWFTHNTQPLALVLLSAAAMAAGFVALAIHRAVASLLGRSAEMPPIGARQRDVLEREKALVLRSLKELEFDRAMGKVGQQDFAALSSRLRARALTLMQDLERAAPAATPSGASAQGRRGCSRCGTVNDVDARFCKQCGNALRELAEKA
jgi:hypothetical protein